VSNPTIDLEGRYCAHNYHPLPVVLVRGEGPWVWDDQGRRFLDMMSAYSAVSHGHAHPRIVEALVEQARKLNIVSRAFHTDRLAAFLEMACRMTGQDMALPMNTGAEAVETALKAARKWAYTVKGVPADRAEIIGCTGNFHGRTIAICGLSTERQYREGFGPFPPGFLTIPYGDADALEAAITPNTAAFLVEPIQGEGGIVIPPEGYLARCAELCRAHNVLLIADEIQTGLGRTGRLLVMDVFRPGDHGSTFGGNPLAATVGLEALKILEEEDLAGMSARKGAKLLARLKDISSPLVKEVRGRGLFIGVEIDPRRARAREVCERLMARGILSKETHETVVRLAPPLAIPDELLDWAAGQLAEVLAEMEALARAS